MLPILLMVCIRHSRLLYDEHHTRMEILAFIAISVPLERRLCRCEGFGAFKDDFSVEGVLPSILDFGAEYLERNVLIILTAPFMGACHCRKSLSKYYPLDPSDFDSLGRPRTAVILTLLHSRIKLRGLTPLALVSLRLLKLNSSCTAATAACFTSGYPLLTFTTLRYPHTTSHRNGHSPLVPLHITSTIPSKQNS